MKSITMVTCRVRAWASAVIRSIWWLLPSTRATQRRSASAKIWATTDAASATTLAVSHLFDVTGPGWIWARSVSSTGRMSALVRGAAVASNTVPTSAIRFRFRFSPLDSRVVSFGRVLAAAAAVAGRSASERITTPVSYTHLTLIHISEPTRLGMRSYAVFCLKKKILRAHETDSYLV